MAKTLQQIIGGENLGNVIREVAGGVPDDVFPPGLMTVTRTVDGHVGEYGKVSNTRKSAKRRPYGSKSQEAPQKGLTQTAFQCIHTIENHRHSAATLINLKGENGAGKQRLGEQTVARQTGEFMRRFRNLRVGALASALAKGAIFFDGNGDQQASTSVVDIDFGIPANNKDQLNGIIGTVWSNAAAKISTDVIQLKKEARKLTGQKLVHALYGENLLDYFLTNTQTKELINRDQGRRDAVARGEIPNGFLGFTWWPFHEAFAEIGGTNTEWVGDDDVVFIPEVSPDWWEFVEGTYPVPTTTGIEGGDMNAALASIKIEQGMFSYGKVDDDPVSVKQVAGDTFMPLITNPNAVYIATVAGF